MASGILLVIIKSLAGHIWPHCEITGWKKNEKCAVYTNAKGLWVSYTKRLYSWGVKSLAAIYVVGRAKSILC